jgi:hypothetical protein
MPPANPQLVKICCNARQKAAPAKLEHNLKYCTAGQQAVLIEYQKLFLHAGMQPVVPKRGKKLLLYMLRKLLLQDWLTSCSGTAGKEAVSIECQKRS